MRNDRTSKSNMGDPNNGPQSTYAWLVLILVVGMLVVGVIVYFYMNSSTTAVQSTASMPTSTAPEPAAPENRDRLKDRDATPPVTSPEILPGNNPTALSPETESTAPTLHDQNNDQEHSLPPKQNAAPVSTATP